MTHFRGRVGRQLDRRAFEQHAVARRELVAASDESVELVELARTERGLDVGQPVVVREGLDLVVPATVLGLGHRAVRTEAAQGLGKGVGVRRHRATFGRRDRLHRVERERAQVGPRAVADRPVGRLRAERVRGVFDHDAWAGRQRGEITGQPGVVHGDEGVARADACRVEVQGLRVDVDEVDVGADEAGAVRARHERERRREHVVARSDARDRERAVQRRGAVREGHRVAGAGGGAQRPFELLDRRTAGQPVTAERGHDGGHVVVADQLPSVGDHPSQFDVWPAELSR